MKVELRATRDYIGLEGDIKAGAPLTVDENRAKELVTLGVADYANVGVGGTERKPAGPGEQKPAGPARTPERGNPSGAARAGRSTATASSLTRGGGAASASSEAALRSPAKARTAVNNAYLLAPWADLLYFADAEWWEWHTRGVRVNELDAREVAYRFAEFGGQKATVDVSANRVQDSSVYVLRTTHERWSEGSDTIATGLNSGYQALNIAGLAGASRVILLGFDMRQDAQLRSNWHNGHARSANAGTLECFAREMDQLAPIVAARGIEVINCTPGSALRAFPRGELESLLPDPRATVVPPRGVRRRAAARGA
jgi:hypothetical protein